MRLLATGFCVLSVCALATCTSAQHRGGAPEPEGPAARPIDVLIQSGSRLTPGEAAALVDTFDGAAYIALREPGIFELVEGSALGLGMRLGSRLDPGALRAGLWLVTEPITLVDEDGFVHGAKPNSLLLIGEEAFDPQWLEQLANVSNGGVTCTDGFYACCGKNTRGKWHAKCLRNGSSPDPRDDSGPTSCINGGPGASSCDNGIDHFVSIAPSE